MKKNLIGLIGIVLILSSALPGLAEVWDAPHRYWDKKLNRWVIYIPDSGPITKAKSEESIMKADACGFITIGIGGQKPVQKIIIDGEDKIPYASKTPNKPRCRNVNGTYTSEWPDGMLTPGMILKTSVSYHYVTTPKAEINVKIERETPVSRKPNPCGFVMFSVSESRKLTTFKVDGVTYDVDDLPEVSHPRICFRSETEAVIYTPNVF